MARTDRYKKKNGYGRFFTGLAALVLILVIVIGVIYIWPRSSQDVTVTIKPGFSSAEIAAVMADNGVVKNAILFKLYISRQNAGDKLQAGEYKLRTGMSFADALAALLQGPDIKYYKITTPEGLTLEQTADTVADNSPITKDEFLEAAVKSKYEFDFLKDIPGESLEGFLFPKTYTVTGRTTAEDLIKMMLRQFQIETSGLDMGLAEKRDMNIYKVVIVGSIIEKEVKLPQERPLVAAVIYNRLDQGMLLQMCATVEYALPDHKEALSYQDLEVESPYNTYKYQGLPPGPIASPGLASLDAALKPAPVDYLYYVLTGEDGSHSFTSNYDEFARIKAEKGL